MENDQDEIEAAVGDPMNDSALLDELLLDLDAITGMIERAHQAARKGKPTVRLIPRGKVRSVAEALDELGDVLTRLTLQVRSRRALRDGVMDERLAEVLAELEDGTAP